jgi:hypothetical protein
VSATHPKPAHALVSSAFANSGGMIVGGCLMGLGVGLGVDGFTNSCGHGNTSCTVGSILTVAAGGAVFVFGLLLLDGESAEFGHLTQAQAHQVGLTRSEWMSFEDELAEVNAVFQDQLALRKGELERTGDIRIEHSRADWEKSSQALSLETYSALKKIAQFSIKSANSTQGQ